jgi:hypothetical protein
MRKTSALSGKAWQELQATLEEALRGSSAVRSARSGAVWRADGSV